MSASLHTNDTLDHSLRLMAAIEQRRVELPFAENMLAVHQNTHRGLEQTYDASQAAVGQWQAALARRWDQEVAARRLYKQIFRQFADLVGEQSPHVQLISRGGAEANSSPAELLEDLRRLRAAISLDDLDLPFAIERSAQIDAMCQALEDAIETAATAEHQRRTAVIENRMAREAYRRACEETLGRLASHYGERFQEEFSNLRDESASSA